MDLRQLIFHAGVQLLQGVALHVRAIIAGTGVFRWGRYEGLLRRAQLHLVDDACLGGHDELLARIVDRIVQQACCRSDEVSLLQDMRLALRMGDQLGLRMADHQLGDLLIRKDLVHHAGTVPDHHIPTGLLHQIGAQVLVGRENDGLILRDTLNDLDRIGGRAADVGQGLHLRRAVDITDHDMVRILLLELAEQRRRTGIRQRATRLQVRQQDLLMRGEDLGCLRHEMDSGKDDDIGIGTGSLLG